MRKQAKAILTLYKTKRITLEGVKKAVKDGIITEAEYAEIMGKQYSK